MLLKKKCVHYREAIYIKKIDLDTTRKQEESNLRMYNQIVLKHIPM